jgi:hypothetical protein
VAAQEGSGFACRAQTLTAACQRIDAQDARLFCERATPETKAVLVEGAVDRCHVARRERRPSRFDDSRLLGEPRW